MTIDPLMKDFNLQDSTIRPMIAILKALPGKEVEFKDVLIRLGREVREEPGCVLFLLYEELKAKGTFIIVEAYANNAAFNVHLLSDTVTHFKQELLRLSSSRQATSLTQLSEVDLNPGP